MLVISILWQFTDCVSGDYIAGQMTKYPYKMWKRSITYGNDVRT